MYNESQLELEYYDIQEPNKACAGDDDEPPRQVHVDINDVY